MDNITQWSIWGAIYNLITGKHATKNFLIGAIITNLPDLDLFLPSVIYKDPVYQFFFHRGITHSLFVAVILSAVLGSIIWYKNKSDIPLWRYVLAIFVSIGVGHLMVDGFTSYGMRYFLPWSQLNYSFDNMPIVDIMLLSILVFLFIILAITHQKQKRYIAISMVSISMIWFVSSFVVKDMVNKACSNSFTRYWLQYGVGVIEKFGSFPKMWSLRNWRCVYKTDKSIYIGNKDAISKEDIIRTETVSYATNSQKEMYKNLYKIASGENKDKLDKIFGFTRWFYYINKIGDHVYDIQNMVFENIWWSDNMRNWVVDTAGDSRSFTNQNHMNITEMIKNKFNKNKRTKED